MKKALSLILCILLVAISFSGCSSKAELTEENVTDAVNTSFQALREFDCKTLNKYVKSTTLDVIIGYAEKKEQFQELGKAIFANLSYEIKSIDLENKTVVVSVSNKSLYLTASDFTQNLLRKYSAIELLRNLSDDSFLDSYLSELVMRIDDAEMAEGAVDITLHISQGDRNIILSFDETAENEVSGGAIYAIKSITN